MNNAFQIGERVRFTQPYLEGTEPQFPWVVITHVLWDAPECTSYYMFRFEGQSSAGFVWFPESMFKKEASDHG